MQGDPAHELGPTIRILAAIIDAVIAHGSLTDEALASVDSAILRETGSRRGRTQTRRERLMAELGVRDQHGIYAAAGLNEIQTEIAFLHFDRLASPVQIARATNRDPVRVRSHLYMAEEKLRKLGNPPNR